MTGALTGHLPPARPTKPLPLAGQPGVPQIPGNGAGDAGHDKSPGATAGRFPPALAVTAVFPASAQQVRRARFFAGRLLHDWPVADDAVACVSELSANAVLHSASREPGGLFWVHVETFPGDYVWVEVRDEGGPWLRREQRDGRPHGLDIVARLAAECGVDGDERTGWIVWARMSPPTARSWPGWRWPASSARGCCPTARQIPAATSAWPWSDCHQAHVS